MDGFQMIATSIGVIGIILLVVLFACRFFGPKTTAWICSNREEKIGFSKSKLYHANGYLIPSGSEFLLNPTGSFKRFDSIDRDYKPIGNTSLTSPTWCLSIPEIPPQPLRPAPISPTLKEKTKPFDKPLKQQSCDGTKLNTAIPRPITKRQHSSPAGYGVSHINLSDAVAKIANGPRSCTNPFLNGSMAIPEDTYFNATEDGANQTATQVAVVQEKSQINPFMWKCHKTSFFSFPSNIQSVNEKLLELNGGEGSTSIPTSLIQLNYVDVTNKYSDSICADAFENLGNSYQKQFRKRSLSDTETVESDSRAITDVLLTNTNEQPANLNDSGSLHKTVSETYLEQYSMQRNRNGSQTWSFGRSLTRHSASSKANGSLPGENTDTIDLKRAMSCDSVNSESSVIVADLEQQIVPAVTGLLCVGLQYDKSTMTDEGIELILTLMEAKELIGPANVEHFDTFVRIYLVPDESEALQTKLFKNSRCPTYNETFSFWLSKKRTRRSLWFHLYHSGAVHTLIGETEFEIGDVRRPITTWLSLSDSRHNKSIWGELMFSLSYLPTAERLTVVVVKARNLKLTEDEQESLLQNVFVKVYLLKDDKKVSKKKTSVKRGECSPIYNESMIFSVPPYMLNSIQVRLTVVNTSETNFNKNSTITSIGHVIVGSGTSGKGPRHWNQMLTSLRKPVAMWHAVRKTNSVKTGNTNCT